MGNIPTPFQGFRVTTWTIEKKLLIWKTISMSACIIGTAVYLRPLEPYLEIPAFGILVPTFIIGYIFINSSDILLLYMQKDYIFLETCFTVIGAIGSLICSSYQFYKWADWVADGSSDDYDTPELVLAFALMLHFISLTAVIIYRILEERRTSSNQAEQ
ncbi:hypothetical protein ANTQUA_LOCUS9186 [Anthophora quadrimaculata]